MITWLTLRIQILDATVLMKFMLSKLLENMKIPSMPLPPTHQMKQSLLQHLMIVQFEFGMQAELNALEF